MKNLIALLPALALLMGGCNSGPKVYAKEVSPAQLEPGWVLAENPTEHVTVGVPPGWQHGFGKNRNVLLMPFGGHDATPPSPEELAAQAAEIERKAQEEWSKNTEAQSKGVLIHCFLTSERPTPGERSTHFQLRKAPFRGADIAAAAAQCNGDLMKGGDPTFVELPIGQAAMFTSSHQTVNGDVYSEIEYVVIDGDSLYKLYFLTAGPSTIISDVAEKVAQSLRITRSGKSG